VGRGHHGVQGAPEEQVGAVGGLMRAVDF
jgi:hypothetical protein